MKKFLQLLLLGTIFYSLGLEAAFGQKRRYNNRYGKNLSTFKGQKLVFPKSKRYNSFGFSVNAFNYFGDLAPLSKRVSTDISFTRPGFGLIWNHRYGPRYVVRTSLTWGRLKADDFSSDPTDPNSIHRYTRNLTFRNDIKELSGQAVLDLFENNGTSFARVKWTPYIFGGIAFIHHNPKGLVPELDRNGSPLENAGKWVSLEPLGTEGQKSDLAPEGVKAYKKFQIAIPVGIGARFRLPNNFDLAFEVGYRHLFTDYLDDVSQGYVDLGILDSELARAMSDRSMEPTAIVAGQARDFTLISNTISTITYVSEGDGQSYTVFNGFGQRRDGEGVDPGNIRGNKMNNDIYFVTSIQLTYILGGKFGRAKFR